MCYKYILRNNKNFNDFRSGINIKLNQLAIECPLLDNIVSSYNKLLDAFISCFKKGE